MRLSIAAAATLAVAAQAFLLPPEVSDSDIGTLHTIDKFETGRRVVEINCPGCPVQIKNRHGKVRVKTDKPNHLSFLFQVESQGDSDRFMVNGYELYPMSDLSAAADAPLTAPQTIDHHPRRKHKTDANEHKGPRRHEVLTPELGFSKVMVESKVPESTFDLSTIALDLQIVSVSHTHVNGIPSLQVKLVKDSKGRLFIEDIHVVESAILQSKPFDKQKECHSAVCKWLAYIEGKVGKPFGNCNKNKQGQNTQQLQSHHKMRPGQFGHHNHHYHRQRTWAQLFKSVISHIVMPVLIGIVAGIASSILGMMVGSGIVMVWRVLFRRSKTQLSPARVPVAHIAKAARERKPSKKEAVVIDEKAGLLEDDDPYHVRCNGKGQDADHVCAKE